MATYKELPIFARIADELKASISGNNYAPGDLLPREVELAESFGISRSTLRNAMAILEKDGWIIRKKRSGTIVAPDALRRKYKRIDIGFFVHNFLNDYQQYIKLLQDQLHFNGVLRQAIRRGYFIRFFPWVNSKEEVALYDLEEVLLRKKVDAFIVASPAYLTDVLDGLRKNRIPHCALETHVKLPGVNSVVYDDEQATVKCIDALVAKGHTRVAYMGGVLKKPELNSKTRRVLNEFMRQVSSNRIQTKEHWIQAPGAHEYYNVTVDFAANANAILASPDRPTAVLTVGSLPAVTMIEVARSKGLRVPEDISIININNENGYANTTDIISGMYYDDDISATRTLDELVAYLRNPAYVPCCHKIEGVFHAGTTLAQAPEK